MPPEEIVRISIGLGVGLGFVLFPTLGWGMMIIIDSHLQHEQSKSSSTLSDSATLGGLTLLAWTTSAFLSPGMAMLFTWSFRLLMFFVLRGWS